MIVRVWHGWAAPADADAYARHATETVFPSLARIDGFRGAMLLRRDDPPAVEFVVETIWESLEAVREFAGDELEVAVVEPAARRVLSRFDDYVRHYQLADSAGTCTCCDVTRSG